MKCCCGKPDCKITLIVEESSTPGMTYMVVDRNDKLGTCVALYLDANSTIQLIEKLKKNVLGSGA